MSSFRLTTTRAEPRIAAVSILLASVLVAPFLPGRGGAPEPAPASAVAFSAPAFDSRQKATEWRAPRLIGVEVDGADGRPVGKVEDLLMTHDGVVRTVVIGVGGFFGLGTKPVAVPFAALQWRMDARPASLIADPVPDAAAKAAAEPSSCAVEAAQGRPDRVGLPATPAQLQSAPPFAYARGQAADFGAAPGGSPYK